MSDGPYKITSYVPNRSITMVRNPAWKQTTDPVRHQYVNEITVTMGVNDAATQLADMQAGKFDLPLDTTINPSSYQQLVSTHDPKFFVWPWISTVPYIVFNLQSPNNGGAMRQPQAAPGDRVRRQQGRGPEGPRRPTGRQGDQHGDPAGQRWLPELQPVPEQGRPG